MNPVSQISMRMNCHKENCHFNGYVACKRFEQHFTAKVPIKITHKYRLESILNLK